jgi:hypothetical protein
MGVKDGMKKFLCCFFFAVFVITASKINAQENDLWKWTLGLQVTTLGEVGVFSALGPFYTGIGTNFWATDDFGGNLYWADITTRAGYSCKFKTGIGILGGAQIRVLYLSQKWGDFDNIVSHFIFMPEIGGSYTGKRLYGNVTFQLDTNNIKNSTVCFVIGGIV